MFSLYCIFALTTAIIANVRIFTNVLALIPEDDPLNESRLLARTVFFILTLLVAPIILLIVLIPSIEETFTVAMAESVSEEK